MSAKPSVGTKDSQKDTDVQTTPSNLEKVYKLMLFEPSKLAESDVPNVEAHVDEVGARIYDAGQQSLAWLPRNFNRAGDTTLGTIGKILLGGFAALGGGYALYNMTSSDSEEPTDAIESADEKIEDALLSDD